MPISRTDDLHFASWLADLEEPGALDDRFEEHRRLACGPEGLPDDALEGLVGCLRQATPAHLCIEVTYGQWTGRAGFWGGEFGTPVLVPDEPGRLAKASIWAADKGVRMAAFGARQRALLRQWWDDMLHNPLTFQGRDFALFRGRLEAVTRWESTMGRLAFRHSPDLIWPDDHSWLVATDPGDLAAAEVVGVWGSSRLTGLLDADPHISSILR